MVVEISGVLVVVVGATVVVVVSGTVLVVVVVVVVVVTVVEVVVVVHFLQFVASTIPGLTTTIPATIAAMMFFFTLIPLSLLSLDARQLGSLFAKVYRSTYQ